MASPLPFVKLTFPPVTTGLASMQRAAQDEPPNKRQRVAAEMAADNKKNTEIQPKSFREAIDTYFPGALPEEEFVTKLVEKLQEHGFQKDNCVPLIGVCK